MRVLVTGAYGLIGSYVTARLLHEGYDVVGAGRDVVQARRRVPRVRWVRADFAHMDSLAWAPILAGVDAVVNCTGALQDSPRDSLHLVHVVGVTALADACVSAGIRRFIQISAAGVATGTDAFSRTKLQADAALLARDLDCIILRPALVLAPAAFGGSALLRGLAACPAIMPVVHADAVVQTLSVEDLAEAVSRSIRLKGPLKITCDLAADQPTRLADILVALRDWLGIAPARVIPLPKFLGMSCAFAADALSWLGWRSPMRSTAIRQLAGGVRTQFDDAQRLLGFTPRSLSETLEGWPAGVQENWFARLYFLKPLTLAMLAAFWVASGVIGFVNRDAAAQVLIQADFTPASAAACVLAGVLADLVVGVLIAVRRTARLGLAGALAVTAAYLIGASLIRPDLWGDPLGSLVKTIPGSILALAALAIMDER
jgi:uncharacterized protein YbjT (DUF2867 family)